MSISDHCWIPADVAELPKISVECGGVNCMQDEHCFLMAKLASRIRRRHLRVRDRVTQLKLV